MKKRRLTCEIEISKSKNVSVKITPLKIESFADFFISKYLNENLETAIAELVAQMISDEIKASASGSGKKREMKLRQIRNNTEKNVRSRVVKSESFILPMEIQNLKRPLNQDLIFDEKKFLDEHRKKIDVILKRFRDAYQNILREKKTPNKTNIARQMFKNHSNPHLAMKRELEKIGITIEEILSVFSQE